MPRPAFTPNKQQQRILTALERLAQRRAHDEEMLTQFLTEAAELGIPIAVMAESADVERKTVYRRLGHPMR